MCNSPYCTCVDPETCERCGAELMVVREVSDEDGDYAVYGCPRIQDCWSCGKRRHILDEETDACAECSARIHAEVDAQEAAEAAAEAMDGDHETALESVYGCAS